MINDKFKERLLRATTCGKAEHVRRYFDWAQYAFGCLVLVASVTASTAKADDDRLQPGECIDAPVDIVSANGRYQLDMQEDGNLVLYDGWTAIWATNTQGDNHMCMSREGVLSVRTYVSEGVVEVLWASGLTQNSEMGYLKVQDDGKLVIYRMDHTPQSWNCRWLRKARPNTEFCEL